MKYYTILFLLCLTLIMSGCGGVLPWKGGMNLNTGLSSAIMQHNYENAATALNVSCNHENNYMGCNDLGVLFATGEGVELDYNKAAKLFSKACSHNIAAGCYNLGWLYLYGKGVDKNISKAVSLYRKACTEHFALGCSLANKVCKNCPNSCKEQ